MQMLRSIMSCCGIQGLQGMYGFNTKEDFFRIVDAIRQRQYDWNNNNLRGAFVQIFTSHRQVLAEKILMEIGFNPVATERNSNSGNRDTIWIMRMPMFNRLCNYYRLHGKVLTVKDIEKQLKEEAEQKRLARNARRREQYRLKKKSLARG